jgi:3-phosphoshikimate 1-carboxyvinyltransferase
MIDEVPVLLALAARASGVTRVRDAAELRVKESDRIAVMAEGLSAMGVKVQEFPDGIDVHGGASRCAPVASHHDHRCAMSLAILGLCSEGGAEIDDAQYIDTSYPGFRQDLAALGAKLEALES